MKRQLLLSLSLSILAANAFAVPAAEQALTAESRSSSSSTVISQPLNPLAEGGSDRLLERNNRVAEGGADRLNDRVKVAEGGSDRVKQYFKVAEGGSDRLNARFQVAEGGSDRLIENQRAS
ncbi:hypothetical protein EXN22_04225 [Pseudomonas tructae]|uniref:Phage infection protein n=1 Tax=Pseudomonas tructae TaxID=2518644 RepID=A0A411ME35_9PSED|nr:hypothetical protein [Pseudomonas tructae]QBF24939.1 hypothetical protein EXN22_04225 [Pseudomonas tructae]